MEQQVIDAVSRHPHVESIRLVGSRARGDARDESDWDFRVEVNDFDAVASALPTLLSRLDPIAQQWDRLSDKHCWMVIVAGPTKVDLIFPDEPHEHESPWTPNAETLAGIDAHFWDWMLWLRSKVAADQHELVQAELRKLFDHLLGPLGGQAIPESIEDAIGAYRAVRDRAEIAFGFQVARLLENAVAPALIGAAEKADGLS